MDQILDPLTRRELEIVQLLATGMTDQEIAENLVVSPGTVKWHVKNIYSKLGTHKRVSAIAHARALGLLKPDSQQDAPQQDAPKHNLPQQPHACIGREVDTSNILTMMHDAKCRLITLVGMGGIGKTRLANHCAGQLIDTFADGVFFVPLEAMSPGFLPVAIADTLNIQLLGQGDSLTKLIQVLRHKQMLLILDNFEHLVGEAEIIAQILETAPRLKMLVTSRETLNLSDEWVYTVEGLSTPDSDEISAVRMFGAPLMFIEHARRVRHDFDAHASLHWIMRLCRLVGGMPLAIELLATWVSVLDCEDIFSEVRRSSDLIATSRRDIQERHRTIRAVFDHSWAMLNSDEQNAFMSMAVFAGGFTREAAEQIAGASLWTLRTLLDKSLIFAGKERRYDLHPLLKQYAEEKLRHSGHESAVLLKHSEYFAMALRQRLTSLRQDAENIWSGIAYANEHVLISVVVEYAHGLWQYFRSEGWYLVETDILNLYRNSISVLESEISQREQPEILRGVLLLYECLAHSLHTAQQYDEARELFERALAQYAGADRLAQARLHHGVFGTYSAQRSDKEAMLAAYEAAEKALGDPPQEEDFEWWQEWIELTLDVAWLHYNRGDIEAMTTLLDRAEPNVRARGTPLQFSKLLNIYTLIDLRRYMYRSLPDETLDNAVSALNAARESGDERQTSWMQFCLGFVHLWRDEFDAAESEFLAALEQVQKFGDSNGTHITTLAYLPLIYRRRQQIDRVEEWASRGLDAARFANTPLYLGTAYAHLGWVSLRRGTDPGSYLEDAIEQWGKASMHYAIRWLATIPLLWVALEKGEHDQAISCARTLIEPTQQQLLDPLPQRLADAIRAWDNDDRERAVQHLIAFCDEAKPFGYL